MAFLNFNFKMKYIPYLIFLFLFISCSDNEPDAAPAMLSNDMYSNAIQELKQASSLEIRYIHDIDLPDTDSIIVINDSLYIKKLINSFSSDTIPVVECDPEGKIYFSDKKGVFKTLYFNTKDSCSYLALVLNGRRYFSKPDTSVINLLKITPPVLKNQPLNIPL